MARRSRDSAGAGAGAAAALLLLLLLAAPAPAPAFYLPGVAPRDFQKDDELQVKVNKLSSTKTQLPYDYYFLEYCKPSKIMNSAENLGEILHGDRIENSVFVFKMRRDETCKVVCRTKFTQEGAKNFKEKIDDEYRVNMILDNLPVAVPRQRRDGSQKPSYEHGFRVGYKGNDEKYFLNNHMSFKVMYHQEPESDDARIVGFEVIPSSVKHEYSSWDENNPKLDTCNPSAKITPGGSTPQEVVPDDYIVFSYDVTFLPSDVKWASRWDTYLLMTDDQIHWFSIINSLMIVLFLSGMIAMIMMRTLYKDIANYNQLETQEEAQEESGWKLVHGDVFRPPTHSGLLCVYVGTGVQFFGMLLVTLIFALLGFLSPSNRGGLMTAMVLLWVFMGLFAGYSSSRLYKMFKGSDWKKNTLKTKKIPTAMAETKEVTSSLHVVVFPWLAFGHMLPFLELSKRLASRGHAVTFVSTPRNAARLCAIPPELSANVRIVSLDLPEVDGLPVGAESTADVPPEKVELLKKAFDGLAAPFAGLVAETCAAAAGEAVGGFLRKPDWIILDFAQNWIWPIAEEHEISCAILFIFPAAMVAFVGPQHENQAHPRTTAEDYMVPPPWIPFPSTLAYRRHEAELIAALFRPNASGVSDIDRFWQMQRPCCRLIVYRSCPEAEPRLFPLLTELFAKPAVPAGLLLPDDVPNATSDQSFTPAMQWLDEQPKRSVIYVALGSEAPVTAELLHELALGLELSDVRFLWALRRPSSHTGELLPDGFESRIAGRGVVCTGWVPQVRVLAHGAVGAFLTHCGWGSTVESFRFGHPLVMLPFVADQGLIAQAMAVRGIGVEVARNYDDGSFGRNGVAAAVRRVMAEEEGKVLARNAKELQEVLGDRARQEQYFDELVECLQRYK